MCLKDGLIKGDNMFFLKPKYLQLFIFFVAAYVFMPSLIKGNTVFSAEEDTFKDPITDMEFVLVKGGDFRMGDTFGDGLDNEKPVRDVHVADFYIGKYEVTQEAWKKVMGYNPSWFNKGGNYPVENVGWSDIEAFILELNIKTNGKYRLPTEAEWEFAARSRGKKEKWAGTNDNVGDYAWCNLNSDKTIHPVGEKKPNGLGIHDMSGNVWEWVFDELIASGRHHNVIEEASYYVRGGSWVNSTKNVRCSYRRHSVESTRCYIYGFRLAKSP